jgi:NADH-quinone oxidoreductase subunit J
MVALAGLYLLPGRGICGGGQIMYTARDHGAVVSWWIMLLNAGVEEHTNLSKLAGPPGLLLVVALAGFIPATLVRTTAGVQGSSQTGAMSSTSGISNMLFRDFVYPFELTSFLILVAVMGATVLAQREKH